MICARIYRRFRNEPDACCELVKDSEIFEEFDTKSLKDAVAQALAKGAEFIGMIDENTAEVDFTMDVEQARRYVEA
jgi:hypothetical protein